LKALKEEGYEVILVNSNPATIMTDPNLADRTYIEPIEPETVARIIEKERPCALLPTLGGQTGLNTAVAVAENGVLEKYGVELIGASLPSIKKAESRQLFRKAMENIGLKVPKSGIARTLDDVREWGENSNFPLLSALPSPSAEPAAASPTTRKTWSASPSRAGRQSDHGGHAGGVAFGLEGI
jgi:carbamoyl-phosphate synthase large subunit